MKYDIFISYSRKDYVDENEVVKGNSPIKTILEFLDKHEISYWFDKEGIYSGSEFVEVIANAIADSKMMLFVSSEHSNESIYTAGEIFEAIENQQLIIPIKIDNSKYNKKFKLLLNPLDYIDITKADAFSDLLKAIEAEKARIAKLEEDEVLRREELKKREWRKAVKTEILEQVDELKKLKETRKALLESIYKKLRSIDVLQKKCPVCDTKTHLESEHCQTCGWFFPTLSEIEGLGIDADKSALILAKSRWEKNIETPNAANETILSLQKEIKTLEEIKAQLTDRIKSLEEKLKNTTPAKSKLTPKFIHAIYISLIILVMSIGIYAYEVQRNSHDYYWDRYLETEKHLENANSTISAISEKMPFIITDVEVKNGDGEYGASIKSEESTYIYPRITYIGLKDGDYEISYKLFYNGELSRNNEISPKEYTLSKNYTFTQSSASTCGLDGWGGRIPGHWPAGNYRIEIWYKGNKLAEKQFAVK